MTKPAGVTDGLTDGDPACDGLLEKEFDGRSDGTPYGAGDGTIDGMSED